MDYKSQSSSEPYPKKCSRDATIPDHIEANKDSQQAQSFILAEKQNGTDKNCPN